MNINEISINNNNLQSLETKKFETNETEIICEAIDIKE